MSEPDQTAEAEAEAQSTPYTLMTGSRPPPLVTDFSRKWDIDDTELQVYGSSIFYMKPDKRYDTEKPYFFNIPVSESWAHKVKQTNVGYTRTRIAISNIRGHEDHFSLDKHGFQLGQITTGLAYDDFAMTETVVSRFYEEVKLFLKQNTGAIDVLPFDFQVRRKDPNLPLGSRGAPGKAQPFAAVHAENDDRVPTDIIFPDYLGETYNFWPNPKHRFYFVDGQRSDEAWMIKCFDSATADNPSIAQFAPHVSFSYGEAGDGSLRRESVEVRTFVFYE
ncbi:hypothetical protein PG985_010164 [Apiospora marii]|uniref:CmcJ-like methyltransferase n=1 Tax=Apiospora marii TaxID=335849 RepID=A0ABR1RLE1_9PEZI